MKIINMKVYKYMIQQIGQQINSDKNEELQKMKVIFLDIDGVLNSDAYFDKIRNSKIQGIKSEIDVF